MAEDVLTVRAVYDAVVEIAALGAKPFDAEVAHAREDALHQRVLRAIADNRCDDPRGCAAVALKTLELKFARWCA